MNFKPGIFPIEFENVTATPASSVKFVQQIKKLPDFTELEGLSPYSEPCQIYIFTACDFSQRSVLILSF
jgi:hypothetical protein